LCPDLPGHGVYPANAGATLEETAVMLLRGLDRHGVECCGLTGYSMGGRIALYLSVHYPKRFSCLILESASPGIADSAARLERRRQDEALARKLSGLYQDELEFYAFLVAWHRQPLFNTLAKKSELLQRRIARMRHNDSRALAAALRGLGTGSQPSLWECLSAIHVPVLLITGAHDQKFTAIAEAMATTLPRARHEQFQECSHCVHEEAPERFAETALRFLHETGV